jgi:hypothetical protein
MALGISKGAKELTNSEKVQARLSIITKGSNDAMGDLMRTNDSYANVVKRFNEHWKDVAETLGKEVQPVLKFFMEKLMDSQSLKAYGSALGLVASMFVAVKIEAIAAAVAAGAFRKILMRTGVGALIVGLGHLADKFLTVRSVNEEVSDELSKAKNAINALDDSTSDSAASLVLYTEEQEKSINSLQSRLELLLITAESEKIIQGIQSKREGGLASVTKKEFELAKSIEERLKFRKELNDELKDEIKIFSGAFAAKAKEISILKESVVLDEIRFTNKKKIAQQSKNDLLDENKATQQNIANQKNVISELKKVIDMAKGSRGVFKATIGEGTEFEETFNSLEELQGALFSYQMGLQFLEQDINNNELSIKDLNKEIEEYGTKAAQAGRSTDEYTETLKKLRDEQVAFTTDKAMIGMFQDLSNAVGLDFDSVGMIDNFQNTMTSLQEIGFDTTEAMKVAFMEMGAQIGATFIQAQMQASEARMAAIKEKAQKDIEEFKSTDRFNKLSQKQKKTFEAQKLKTAQKAMKKEFENQKEIKRAGVIMNTAAAIMNIWGSATMGSDPITKGVLTGLVTALGALQLETINTTPAPKMAKGGYVGGRLHSQGGTMIEAERGEFVMSRDAVDSVGLETMNRINQGGGAGVNVSFSGNVMSGDFIENEAIPKIKEAIRRGADIGVS